MPVMPLDALSYRQRNGTAKITWKDGKVIPRSSVFGLHEWLELRRVPRERRFRARAANATEEATT